MRIYSCHGVEFLVKPQYYIFRLVPLHTSPVRISFGTLMWLACCYSSMVSSPKSLLITTFYEQDSYQDGGVSKSRDSTSLSKGISKVLLVLILAVLLALSQCGMCISKPHFPGSGKSQGPQHQDSKYIRTEEWTRSMVVYPSYVCQISSAIWGERCTGEVARWEEAAMPTRSRRGTSHKFPVQRTRRGTCSCCSASTSRVSTLNLRQDNYDQLQRDVLRYDLCPGTCIVISTTSFRKIWTAAGFSGPFLGDPPHIR